MQSEPKFTVIIPTRNRPVLFKVAFDSVLAQTGASFEIVVVKDGSDAEHEAAYREIEQAAAGRARFFDLPHTSSGHGQSYALNFGAAKAVGQYLCFLDDDDEWIDPGYLDRAEQGLAGADIDLHLSDQKAYVAGKPVGTVTWIEDLKGLFAGTLQPDALGAYSVQPADLLRSHGFCHLNTTIIRRSFFAKIGGFDDNIRYECDRDFYLRAIDRASGIKYSPFIVSRHNVPDPAFKTNMSTLVSSLERQIFQIRVLDKAIVFSRHPEIRQHGRLHKMYALKKMAQELARSGSYDRAAYYAREALLLGFNPKWLAYSLWLSVKAMKKTPGSAA